MKREKDASGRGNCELQIMQLTNQDTLSYDSLQSSAQRRETNYSEHKRSQPYRLYTRYYEAYLRYGRRLSNLLLRLLQQQQCKQPRTAQPNTRAIYLSRRLTTQYCKFSITNRLIPQQCSPIGSSQQRLRSTSKSTEYSRGT